MGELRPSRRAVELQVARAQAEGGDEIGREIGDLVVILEFC